MQLNKIILIFLLFFLFSKVNAQGENKLELKTCLFQVEDTSLFNILDTVLLYRNDCFVDLTDNSIFFIIRSLSDEGFSIEAYDVCCDNSIPNIVGGFKYKEHAFLIESEDFLKLSFVQKTCKPLKIIFIKNSLSWKNSFSLFVKYSSNNNFSLTGIVNCNKEK